MSRSGYYRWLQNADAPHSDHQDYLLIKEIFEQGKSKYGFRTIKMKLDSEKHVRMNHKKIIRIMKKYGLYTKIRRMNPYRMIMKKTLEHTVFDNLLNRHFVQEVPNKVFCTDITYLPHNHQMAYLSVIKDIADGAVVAWNLSRHIDISIATDTLERMMNSPDFAGTSLHNIMIHSDQGVQYTHPQYVNMVQGMGMIQSMSRKGNCIDNAPMESFFGHMKDEVDYKACRTFEELRLLITHYMHYYNNHRYQWDLNRMAPVEYGKHLLLVAA